MPELEEILPGVLYLPGRVNCGLVLSGKDPSAAIAIDSGLDEDSGRRLLLASERVGTRISAIVNTHAHVDHYSGNSIIVRRTGAKVYAPAPEGFFLRNPRMEPFSLFGMARAPEEFEKSKFLTGIESPCDFEVSAGILEISGEELELVDLSGHSPAQKGVLARRVLFAGDAIFGEDMLKKHGILFCSDVESALASLDRISALASGGKLEFLLPSHGKLTPAKDVPSLVEKNRENLLQTAETILSFCNGVSSEQVLKETADSLGLEMSAISLVLNHSTVRAHLTRLLSRGLVRMRVFQNVLIWEKVN